MPKVESLNDRAAKEKMIASHRWLGANTAAPLFYAQQQQADLTAEFLKQDVLDVDFFALRRTATDKFHVSQALTLDQIMALSLPDIEKRLIAPRDAVPSIAL